MTPEQNEYLTRVGPGTPMGRLFRRYWLPAVLSEELPEPDCPPVRVTLLGEPLVAFRDTDGRVGLLDEFCPHRQASLWLGRNEERGLRCVEIDLAEDIPRRAQQVALHGLLRVTLRLPTRVASAFVLDGQFVSRHAPNFVPDPRRLLRRRVG